MNNFST